jgi:transcriptional regulator with XRE-family HTH domain
VKRPRKPSNRQPVDADLIVGANVRKFRGERQATLADVSAALGMSHQQLQKYETGANRVSAGVLYELAKYFAVPIETFYEDEGSEGSQQDSQLLRAQRKCHAIIDRTSSAQALDTMSKVLRAILDGRS